MNRFRKCILAVIIFATVFAFSACSGENRQNADDPETGPQIPASSETENLKEDVSNSSDKKEDGECVEHTFSVVKEVSTGHILVECAVCGLAADLYDEVDESEYDSDESHFKTSENGDGTLTVTSYTGNSDNVKFPSHIGGKPVKTLDLDEEMTNPEICSVIISEGIERLGEKCFCKWLRLESVYFSTGLKELGVAALARTSVSHIYLPDGLLNIDIGQFGRSSTQFVYIPASVTHIGLDQIILWSMMDGYIDEVSGAKGFAVAEDNDFYSSKDGCLCDKEGNVLIRPR